MAERIPQSVSYLVVFRAFLASDGKTPATGKTIAITISKNGAAFVNPNVGALNATEISNGFYKFTLDTTDSGTKGPLAWRGAEGTINDAGDVLTVASANNAGFAGVPDAAAEAAGGLFTRGTGAGQIRQDANGRIDANAKAWVDGAIPAVNQTGVPLIDLKYTLGTISPATAGSMRADAVTGAVGSVAAGVTVSTNNDKTGYGLSTSAVQAIWDALTSALTTAGSIGKLLVDNINATISSRSTYAGTDTSGTMTLLSRIGSALTISGGAVTVGTNNDKTGYALSAAGLDQISIADPGAPANVTTFPKMLVALWRRFFKKSTLTVTQLKTYADDGATIDSTQTVSDDGTTQTQGAAS